ncbi:hypothetical protein COJ85_04910 [Bacillus sp. AFS076308]|nr:hypothetical protein COJ85_04910 [Bacillus sp. AFS076308]PGV51406.1 hypothetical protein COD92_14300 [Bacillus sp. AFS037270]
MITLIVLMVLTFGITHYTNSKFIDYAFVVGLAATVVIWFFTSKGGVTTRIVDGSIQGSTGVKTQGEKFEFSPSLVFITSLAYTILSFASMLFYYRSYL